MTARNGLSSYVSPRLITTRILAYAYPNYLNATPGSLVSRRFNGQNFIAFMVVGHAAFALAFGVLGGWLAQYLYAGSGSSDASGEKEDASVKR